MIAAWRRWRARRGEGARLAAVVADAHLVLDEAGILAGPLSDRISSLVRQREAARSSIGPLLARALSAEDQIAQHVAALKRVGVMVLGVAEVPRFLGGQAGLPERLAA